jgi:branched-subunit amino acid aminotransferase/4-amino-4-deoxychorismate lyase
MGSGPVLGLAPAPEYTFLIFVSPVGNYFKVPSYVFLNAHLLTIVCNCFQLT